MYRVGITGGIGSGKTLVCKIMEVLGVAVYYADEAAKRIMSEDSMIKESLKELIGRKAYVGNRLNRAFIASRIFSDERLLKQINQLVHPAVQRDFDGWAARVSGSPYVIEEAALLFESGAAGFLDAVVLVYASEGTRIRRVAERDGTEEHLVRDRMRHQMDEEEKRKLADHVIYNDGNDLLIPQVVKLHQDILKNIQ
ncbi:MAG: dephospho-CoA kinase [Bacteroidales bacterium]|nr:dephospho-CoA kinase [Bacteroidales bacterium]MBN2698473.1 dephospho-CoA kinase [Bacteroidales bacterium]